MLFARAVVAFLILPGTVAGLVPWLLRPRAPDRAFDPLGLMPIGVGAFLLLWCVRDFYVAGKGTLAPWAPPRNLVVIGLYRVSRNPMYLAVSLILIGWAIAWWSLAHAIYAAAVVVAFHVRVVYGEEPYLARAHGEAWTRYTREVPRWFLRG